MKKLLEKSIDHRNEGFTAKDAFYEQRNEASATNRVSYIKKEGLKMYTEKELAEKAGAVTEYNYNLRYSWGAFKKMPTVNKQEYVAHLRKKYPGISATDLGEMFGVSAQSVLNHLAGTNQRFEKGRKKTDGIQLFRRDMITPRNVVGIDKSPAVLLKPEDEPVQETVRDLRYDIQKVSVVCDAGSASEVLYDLGLTGRVYITAEVLEEKEVA